MKWNWIVLFGVLVCAAACNRSTEQPRGAAPDEVAAPGPVAPEPPAELTPAEDQPTIEIANWEETQQLVAQNAGKVVILDLWATW